MGLAGKRVVQKVHQEAMGFLKGWAAGVGARLVVREQAPVSSQPITKRRK